MNKKIQPKTSKIEQNVMDRIKKGEVKMKPQSYYLIVGFLGALTVLLLSLITAYFISVTTLWLRIQAAQGPAYRAKNNLFDLLGLFPWWALIIGALSLVLMIWVIKRIGSLYKIRLIYLIPSIVISFLVIGLLLSYSSLPRVFDGRHQNTTCQEDGLNCRPSNMRYDYRL